MSSSSSTSSPLFLLFVFALSLLSFLSFVPSLVECQGVLRFIPHTLAAPWTPRWDSNMEWYPHALTFTPVNAQGVAQTPITWPGRVMIIQGSGRDGWSNDIWASGNMGFAWYLIAGNTSRGIRAAGARADSSFRTTLSRAATGVDGHQRIYRVGGSDANNNLYNHVWMSTNGGLTWTNQAALNGAQPFVPGRDRSSLMFDAEDNLYLIGGEIRIDGYLMTSSAFKSTDQGIRWETIPSTPWPARSSGIFLHHESPKLKKEILTYFTGWDGRADGLYNEVWVSSDLATTWERVKSNWGSGLPPFKARDAANAEVTSSGVMILVGGQSVEGSNRETLNDVWVSMDGGFSWGLCAEDATFEDRRDVLTMLDDEGYLFVAGGTDYVTGRSFNDVWRSSFSFNNLTAVREACGGIRAPACGPGLVCWPLDPRTTFYSNGTVTCPASRECAGLVDAYLDFDIQTNRAPYKPRWAANAEFFPKAISYTDVGGTPRTAPAGALVMSGGWTDSNQDQTNDVWLSPDAGISWALIAGYSRRSTEVGGQARAYGSQAESSFWPVRYESTGIVDHKNGFIYRIGGYGSGVSETNDVWRTTNAVAWQKMPALNLRVISASNVVIDDAGKIFVAGGVVQNVPQNLFMISTDNGTSFYSPSPVGPPFMGRPGQNGRAKAFLLHRRSPRLNRDILVYGSGWNGTFMFNDVWASSDEGVTWTVVCAAAPFEPRDAASAEITEAGLIVMGGGQAGGYTMNDVWVSPDGGFTWSVCASEAYWPDRREMSTAMDRNDYFYVLNGRASAVTNPPLFNDVYRSSISFANAASVRAACNINIPACGVGMTCWPGAVGTVVTATGVTCPAIAACQAANFRPSSSSSTGVVRRSSSSSSPKPRIIPYDPCDDDPVTDPDCPNYVTPSTGWGNPKPSGLSSWAIGGIVVLVVAVVGGFALFMYKRWKGQQPAAYQHHLGTGGTMTGENLLGEGETSTSDYTAA